MKFITAILAFLSSVCDTIGSMFRCSHWDDFADLDQSKTGTNGDDCSGFDDSGLGHDCPTILLDRHVEPMFPKPTLPIPPAVHPVTKNILIRFTPTQTKLCRQVSGGNHRIEVIGSKGARSPFRVIGTVNDEGAARIRPFGHAGAGADPVLCHLKFQDELNRFGDLAHY